MKDKALVSMVSIKTNNEIVKVLKTGRKFNLPYITIWLEKQNDKSVIQYALLVNKTQFKLAVLRNKVKRQLRNILINSSLQGGIKVLLKPNSLYLNKDYLELEQKIIQTINKYQHGK